MSRENNPDDPIASTRESLRLEKLFRSDLLPALVGLARSVAGLAPTLRGYVQFHMVLDANIIQGELRWRLGSRREAAARTGLHEAITAGVLVGKRSQVPS